MEQRIVLLELPKGIKEVTLEGTTYRTQSQTNEQTTMYKLSGISSSLIQYPSNFSLKHISTK